MNYVYGDSLERRDEEKQLWSLNYIYTMRALAKRKIDEITARSMQNCEEHLITYPTAAPTGTSKNVKGVAEPKIEKEAYINTAREDTRVGVWINYDNKGYKTAPITFADLEMNADWPKLY